MQNFLQEKQNNYFQPSCDLIWTMEHLLREVQPKPTLIEAYKNNQTHDILRKTGMLQNHCMNTKKYFL